MIRCALAKLVILSLAFAAAGTAHAQDDLTFTTDDTTDAGGDDLSFDVIDTEKTAAEVEHNKQAELDLIRVIQRRPFLKRRRVEFSPMLGTNVNDPMVRAFIAGANLNYHITEVMAFGINGGYSLGSETDLFDQTIEDYELFPEVAQVQWFAGVQFQYAPIYGKFALFDTWIVPWDLYGLLGAGWTETDLAGHPTLSAGLGQRFFLNRWLSLNYELRDYIYNEDYSAGSELVNNLVFTLGVGFYLPTNFEYTTLK